MRPLEAAGVLGPGPEDPSPSEIDAAVRDELAHHLACVAEHLTEHGLAPEEARREAERRFGDLEAVRRACVHVQTRGNLMKKRLHLAVTGLLAVAVVFLLVSGQAARRAMQEAARAQIEAEQARALVLAARRSPEPVEHILLGVGDLVTWIDDYNESVRGSQRVAADGKILLPEIGWFHVAGLTREEAEAAVTEAMKPYFTETDVKLMVDQARDPR